MKEENPKMWPQYFELPEYKDKDHIMGLGERDHLQKCIYRNLIYGKE